MSEQRPSETPCVICGLGTTHPPTCIECDMTGRARAVNTLIAKYGLTLTQILPERNDGTEQ